MDHIELPHELGICEDIQRVPEHELERVVTLRLQVHAEDVEPCTVVADRRAPTTAEQVKELRSHPSSSPMS